MNMTVKLRHLLAVTGLVASVTASLAAGDRYFHPWDGSREVPVHRIPLTDDDGQSIMPQDPRATPFSTRATCGICHDYEAISGGWHFNAGATAGRDGRAGEPWVWVDETTGMQIPLSSRNWPGVWTPSQLGLTPWKFTTLFGRHMPGGGPGEPADTLADAEARWDVSGRLEINCLACHSASPKQDMTEWAKQVARENFRWAATAASGMAEVGGMAARLRESWAPYDGQSLDDKQYAVAPSVRYDQQNFNSKGLAFFDIATRPQDNRCEHCHSAVPVGMTRHELQPDVHTAAGLKCVDCHKNGISHQIDRGVGGEHSCRSCHLGEGRYKAPKPEHKGLPPHHLQKLACTVCHSGTEPGEPPTVVRTSRANRLGIFGKAKWDTALPEIVEPVFVQNGEGQIEPHRMMWPSFWARVKEGRVTPIPPEEVQQVSTGILDTAQQVARVVSTIQGAVTEAGEAVYSAPLGFVAGGRIFRVNVDGGLDLCGEAGAGAGPWMVLTSNAWSSAIPAFAPDKFNPSENKNDDLAAVAVRAVFEALKAIAPASAKPVLIKSGKVMAINDAGELAPVEQPIAPKGETWAWLTDGRIEPMVPDFAVRTVGELAGTGRMLTEEQVALILKKLGGNSGYISSGKLFQMGSGGTLTASTNPAAEPVSWAFGHDVRPSMKALGAKGCGDCHNQKSSFFFAQVQAQGPLKTRLAAVTPMYAFEKQEANYNRLFGMSFTFRPYFKMMLLGAMGVTAAVFFLYLMLALVRLTELRGYWWLEVGALVFTALSGLALFLFALAETLILGHPLVGYPVMIRMAMLGLFALSLALLAVLRARENSFHRVDHPVASLMQRLLFWAAVAGGLVVVAGMLAAMVPVLGERGQHMCMWLHRGGTLVVVFAIAGYSLLAVRARQLKS